MSHDMFLPDSQPTPSQRQYDALPNLRQHADTWDPVADIVGEWREAQTWRDQAACKDQPTRLFFGERGESVETARRICAGCPVRQQCLDYALAVPERVGVWGGLSESQRRKMRRLPGRPRPDCGTNNGYNYHHTHHETICDPCRHARRSYMAAHRVAAPPKKKTA